MAAISKASAPEMLTQAPGTLPAKRHSHWFPALLIFLVTIAAYLPIWRAGFIWDDDSNITSNRLLRDLDGLQKLWTDPTALPQYYPLTHTFLWLDYHLWGYQPLGYHLENLLIHAGSATLAWIILKRLAVPGALFAALLFAVHPVNVETVGWASERKNTLSCFFYLLSLLSYLRFDQERSLASPRRSTWYFLSLTLFFCSLLCKTVSCTLPAAILLILWWRDNRVRLRDVVLLLPFFAVGIILGLETAHLERTHVGAFGHDFRFAPTMPGEVIARCLIAGRAVWFYLLKLILPYPLMFEYPRWQIDISTPWQYLFPLSAVIVLLTLFLLRNRITRGPLVGMLFFVGTLFPALGFADVFPMRYSFVADHFQYLATLGPLTLVAAALSQVPTRPAIKFFPMVLAIVFLGVLTFSRCFAFQNLTALYTDSISKNPNGWMTQTNYGVILKDRGDVDEGKSHLLIGIRLHPANAAAAANLGQLAEASKQYDQAIDWFGRAIEVEPTEGSWHYELARLLEKRGDGTGAKREYQSAVTLAPNHAPAHLDYGVFLANQADYEQAVTQFKAAVRIDPASSRARRDLIAALERSDHFDQAAEQIHILLQKLPDDAKLYYDLGLVETARHQTGPAMAAFSHALVLNPQMTQARHQLDALTTQPATQAQTQAVTQP
jgi:tetratricopeptide (TPR) repeat protein